MIKRNYLKKNVLSLFFLPLITALLSLLAKAAAGPFWLGVNSDPSYLYLINSLYLADGLTPYFVDHPGTTLQMLGALLIKITNCGASGESLARDVLSRPEMYLHMIHAAIIFLYIISLFIVGYYAYRKTKSMLFALFLQSTSLLFFSLRSYISTAYVLPVIANVNSDTFLLVVMNLYLLCLIKLYKQQTAPKNIYTCAWLWGIVCALGITTKLTFIPMLILPLALLPKLKSKAAFVLTFFLAGFFCLLPILFVRYQEIYGWVAPIITGADSAANIPHYLRNLFFLAKEHLLLLIMTLTGLGISLAGSVFSKKRGFAPSKENTYLMAIALTCLLQFFFIAKRQAPHYMAPAYALSGALLGFIYLSSHLKNRDKYAKGFLAGFIVFLTIASGHYLYNLKKTNRDILAFSHKVYSDYPSCVVFGYYRSSSIPAAIEFAHAHGNMHIYSQLLKDIYPDSYFFNMFHRTFHNWEKNIFLKGLLDKGPYRCALLYGSKRSFGDYLDLKMIEEVASEALYQITSTTLDEAHMSYLIAQRLEAQKNYQSAFLFALRAKELGRPALDPYIRKLKGLVTSK